MNFVIFVPLICFLFYEVSNEFYHMNLLPSFITKYLVSFHDCMLCL
ncbi:hypothetical protein GLYMA_11G148801v4 [Glycine max]|nr:hypothetical protein GLYMA_11G148801v4 [Glycine max]KAH1159501.1 hypothetical protein GYH30_031290 [Glycine max]